MELQQGQTFPRPLAGVLDVLSSRGLLLTVLEVPLNFFPIVVYKSSGVFQASIEKRFKLILRDQNRAICIPFLLKLLLVEADPIPKEGYGKRNLVRLFNSNSGKIILILLTRVVVFYVRFPAVYIRGASFQRFILGLFRGGKNSNFWDSLKNPL